MIKVSVLYPNDEGSTFDMTYYADKHVPLIQKMLGDAMKKFEIDEGVSGPAPGSRPAFVAAVHMYFDSADAFYTAFSPHAKDIRNDVANYTNLKPITQISKVRA